MDVALGEAFINVRADLKPFAKDLERDLKKILAAAEKKVAADPNTGRALGDSLRKRTGDGVSEGFEEGSKRGSKKGFKSAMSEGEKFFAALADFADDGLSAIPGKVKAGILIGVVAAAAIVAPFLGGVITAAIVSGISLGVVGLGIAVASQLKPVEDQFTALGRSLLDKLRSAAGPLIEPLLLSASMIDDAFNGISDSIKRTFGQAALQVEPLTRALTGFITELMPGIESAVRQARPLIEALATSLPKLGADLALAFRILADGSPEAALALRDLLAVLGQLIIVTASFIRGLTDLWFWMRVIAATAAGDLGTALFLIAQREQDAALATGQITGEVDGLTTGLGKTAEQAYAARNAIESLIKTQLKGFNATIDYEQAIDDLSKSIAEGNHNFDVRDEKGRTNLRLVESAIASAARQRDIELERAAVTGRSVDDINAAYQREITTIETVIGKNNAQNESLKDVFKTARNAPKDVAVEVKTPGLKAAIFNLATLQTAIRRMAGAGISVIVGSKTPSQHALGTITSGPEVALIGEAGKEAVIPDPSKMPARALQLSNQFGLTSLIADSLKMAAPIVNVFLGTERLDARVDYRISVNNQLQGTSMAYGPRGI